MVSDYGVHGHNLNLYVGWASVFLPTSLKKVKFVTAKSLMING